MHRKIIANTSPLFYLHRLGYFDILHKLYGEIIIPFSVMKELEEGFKIGEDVPRIYITRFLYLNFYTGLLLKYD